MIGTADACFRRGEKQSLLEFLRRPLPPSDVSGWRREGPVKMSPGSPAWETRVHAQPAEL